MGLGSAARLPRGISVAFMIALPFSAAASNSTPSSQSAREHGPGSRVFRSTPKGDYVPVRGVNK